MTIAVTLKVGDGLVFGADSASTLMSSRGVHNVYFNADKVFNLVKGWPIGAVTYGLGGLDGRSVASLTKELREKLTSADDEWRLDPNQYTMSEVAERVHRFFIEDLYHKEFPGAQLPFPEPVGGVGTVSQNRVGAKPAGEIKDVADVIGTAGVVEDPSEPEADFESMGFLIGGFSAKSAKPEMWQVEVNEAGECTGPERLCDEAQAGLVWAKGQPEALYRLVRGYSPRLLDALVNQVGMTYDDARRFLDSLGIESLVHSAMPIQDAIDLVKYMVDVTCQFVRFTPGAPTVAPPIDIAVITKHEGFKWVERKHYYRAEMNPPVQVHLRR